MQIFIDFDDVIIDTKALKRDYFEVFKKFGVSAQDAAKSYAEVIGKFKGYKISNHIDSLVRTYPGLSTKRFNKALSIFFKRSKKYVFGDSISFLKWLKSNDYKPIMVSSGDLKLQKDKIDSSGVKIFFNKIKIISDYYKTETLKQLRAKNLFVFIDDKAEIIDDVKTNFPGALVIQLLRHENQKQSKKCDFAAKNFKEIKNFLTKNVQK